MRKLLCFIFSVLVIWGCSYNQRPSWFIESERQLDTFKRNYLTVTEGLSAESNFKKAIEAIKKSGDLDLLQKVWLTRMALQGAVLKDIEVEDYRKIAAVEPIAENENFYMFVKGNVSSVDIKLLPEQYRDFTTAILKGDALKMGRAVTSMKDDPVSQLIAAGIAVRCNIENEAIIQIAVETASINGWKMALITWLERLAAFYDVAGNTEKADKVHRRIDLIEK